VDYPVHRNIGDLLINAGCEHFFLENEVNVWRRYNHYDFPRQIQDISRNDVFLLHGGGNFGDLYFHTQRLRESILEMYPLNRVIFLPQTVHFASEALAQASIAKMNLHNNLHVFARDLNSLTYLQRLGLRSVSAMPDMAHALAGVIRPASKVKAAGTMRLLRLDVEASSTPDHLTYLEGDTRDWRAGITRNRHLVKYYAISRLIRAAGTHRPPFDLQALWYQQRDLLIKDGIEAFSSYERVLTNRLHGMILGLLLGREVIAFDNSYGKLSAYVDSWLRGVEGLTFHYSNESSFDTSV
jgi:pyruvyl transferase EpsO